jgi:hypothetical protein
MAAAAQDCAGIIEGYLDEAKPRKTLRLKILPLTVSSDTVPKPETEETPPKHTIPVKETDVITYVTEPNYDKKTNPELIAICKERKLKGYSGMNKNQLIKMLQQKDSIPASHQTNDIAPDKYSEEVLKSAYALHKNYVIEMKNLEHSFGIKIRLPGFPEHISENITKFIIHNKLNDKTSRWECVKGDLLSAKEGSGEVKCYMSDGPISFTPSSDWDVIYFLDARNWLTDDTFILYRVELKMSSVEWGSIMVSSTQSFKDQCKQRRRPRITWDSLYPKIKDYCHKVYEGTFENIFIPVEAKE